MSSKKLSSRHLGRDGIYWCDLDRDGRDRNQKRSRSPRQWRAWDMALKKFKLREGERDGKGMSRRPQLFKQLTTFSLKLVSFVPPAKLFALLLPFPSNQFLLQLRPHLPLRSLNLLIIIWLNHRRLSASTLSFPKTG